MKRALLWTLGILLGLPVGLVLLSQALILIGGGGLWSEGMQTLGSFAALAVALVVGGVFYFVPSLVAGRREHPQCLAIGVLNLFLGWTLLGWVGALVWACTKQQDRLGR